MVAQNSHHGPPIDRGWAWVVMIAHFINMMFCVGYVRSFGILFFEFRRVYQATSSATALIMGVQGGVFSVSGFLAQNVLMTYVSERVTIVTGGILSALGVILSFFATNLPILIVTQSTLIGCGHALVIGPGFVLLGRYFNKHRSLAIAIANSGANLGSIIMPILISFLLDEFGLKGVFLIYGALTLNIVAFGSLLRPIESYKSITLDARKNVNKNTVQKDNKSKVEIPEIRITPPEVDRLLPENETENSDVYRSRTTSASSRTFKHFIESYSESSAVKYSSTPDLACLSVHDIPQITDADRAEKKGCFRNWLNKVIDFSLFRKACFYLILAVAFLGIQAGGLMGIYIPTLAIDKGATKNEAAILLAVSGGMGIFSRIAIGFFADRGIMKRNHILALAMFVSSVSALLSPIYHSFASLMAYSLVYGFFGALYFSLIPVLIVDFLGLEKLPKTFGFIQLTHGVSLAVSHPIAGLLRDITDSFNASYQFFGACAFMATILLMLEPVAHQFDDRKSQNIQSTDLIASSRDAETKG